MNKKKEYSFLRQIISYKLNKLIRTFLCNYFYVITNEIRQIYI